MFNWSCFGFRFILSVALIFDLGVHPGCKIGVFLSVDFRPPTSEFLGSLLEIYTASWAPPQASWIKISWEWASGLYLFYQLPHDVFVPPKLKLKGSDQWVSTGHLFMSSGYDRVMHTVGIQHLLFLNISQVALSGLSSSKALWLTAWSQYYERPFLTLSPWRKYSWRWNWLNTPKGLQQNWELPDVQAGFRQAKELEIKLPTPAGS